MQTEEGIVFGLEEVLEGPEWILSVDLDDTETFGRFHSDMGQMAAARSIMSKAITMVSGRGGTGKTEVVSAVLKAAEAELSVSAVALKDCHLAAIPTTRWSQRMEWTARIVV